MPRSRRGISISLGPLPLSRYWHRLAQRSRVRCQLRPITRGGKELQQAEHEAAVSLSPMNSSQWCRRVIGRRLHGTEPSTRQSTRRSAERWSGGPWVVRGWHSFPSPLTSFKHSGPRASVHGGRHGRAPMRANKALLGYQDGACGVHKRRDTSRIAARHRSSSLLSVRALRSLFSLFEAKQRTKNSGHLRRSSKIGRISSFRRFNAGPHVAGLPGLTAASGASMCCCVCAEHARDARTQRFGAFAGTVCCSRPRPGYG